LVDTDVTNSILKSTVHIEAATNKRRRKWLL
jgi:hypothetical protein